MKPSDSGPPAGSAVTGETVTQAYRFALAPTPGQRGALASHEGAARYARHATERLLS